MVVPSTGLREDMERTVCELVLMHCCGNLEVVIPSASPERT